MNVLTGKSIKWSFADGPVAGTLFQHTFHDDGSVTWTILDGTYKGATAREKPCAAVRLSDNTVVMSYLAASGHTLTVALNLDEGRMSGFASSDKEWSVMSGTFEMIE
jgi:hypothetical protein